MEEIGKYVKTHIVQWMKESEIIPFPHQDRELLDRMVRLEEGLKFRGETLKQMMIQSDKRFAEIRTDMEKRLTDIRSEMDKRFSDLRTAMDKRFNRLYVFLSGIFLTMLAGFIPLIIKAI